MSINPQITYRMTLISMGLLCGGAFILLIGLVLERLRVAIDGINWADLIAAIGGVAIFAGMFTSLPSMLMGVVLCMRERRWFGWVGFLFVFWFFGAGTLLLFAKQS